MSKTYCFYIAIDHIAENSDKIIQLASALISSCTNSHSEHREGISTFQITTADLSLATKIKLIFGTFILYEESIDA